MHTDLWNEQVAQTYDESAAAMYAPEVLGATVDFLARRAGGGRALELAIGTGRVALALSARGVPVAGIDLSTPMVAQLRKKPGGSDVLVVIGDMSSARVPGQFRLVYLVFNTITNLLTLMIPFQAILTPLFLELNAMGLTNSRLGLVLFYSTVNLPFGVFVMRTSFASVPAALEEAARVDGAGTFRTFTEVLRPLVVPGMATTALYAFLAAWTEFLGALTFLTSENLYTLPVSLVNLQLGAYGEVNYGFLAAGAVIAMIPCVILFVALQRYYVEGMAAGGVKG